MTSGFLENVEIYLLSKAETRYCMIYFDKSPKRGFDLSKLYINFFDIGSLKISNINQYKTLRSDFFVIYINPYY